MRKRIKTHPSMSGLVAPGHETCQVKSVHLQEPQNNFADLGIAKLAVRAGACEGTQAARQGADDGLRKCREQG